MPAPAPPLPVKMEELVDPWHPYGNNDLWICPPDLCRKDCTVHSGEEGWGEEGMGDGEGEGREGVG